jgi:hypothetical protein
MQNNRESGFHNPHTFPAFGGALLALISVPAPTPPSKQILRGAPTTGFRPNVRRFVLNTVAAPVREMPKVQVYGPRASEEEEGPGKVHPDRPIQPNSIDSVSPQRP